MIKVYVAGAYSSNNVIQVLKHIGRGQDYASRLFLKGYAPFTPWLDKEYVINNWDQKFIVGMFYNYSMEWLYVSDCVFIVPNYEGLKDWQESTGTLAEIEEAKKLGLPVFYSLNEIDDYYANK